MKYKDRDELVTGLRAFADFIEEKGLELPISYPQMKCSEILYNSYDGASAREKMRRVALVLGSAEKVWEIHYLNLHRKFGPITLEFSVQKDYVCEKVVVGFKDVPEHTTPERREEIIEWTCRDSILAPTT